MGRCLQDRCIGSTDAHDPGVPRPRRPKTTQIYAHYAPSAHEVEMVNEAFADELVEDAGSPS
jgi:hypothetical protein